jgi:TRAP-type C4-dicarboxylate transport system permease small subunit
MFSRDSSAEEGAKPVMPERRAVFDVLADRAVSEVQDPGADQSGGTRFEQILVGSVALAALLLCSYNVFVRYFFPPLVLEMSDEVQVYLIVWSIFLSLGLVTAADRHVKADLFLGFFSVSIQKRLLIFTEFLGFTFSLFLVVYGGAVAWETYTYGDLSITSLRFPLWIYAACLPVGALLMGVRYLLRLAKLLQSRS